MITIGLTGSMASGKTELLKCFRRLGAATVNADDITRSIYKNNTVLRKKIFSAFGAAVKGARNSINTKTLGKIVFNNQRKRKLLEKLTHPLIIRHIKAAMKNISKKKYKLLVIEVPLLFEAKLEKLFDKTLVIYSTKKNIFSRLSVRDSLSRAEIVKRLNTQMPVKQKLLKADIRINNSASKEELFLKAHAVFDKIIRVS